MERKLLNRIKVVLAEKNESNKWLSEQLDKDPAIISKWITNTTQPNVEMYLSRRLISLSIIHKGQGLETWTGSKLINFRSLAESMSLLPGQNDDKGPIDWKEVRAFPKIGGECFESVYLGINMNTNEKSKIVSDKIEAIIVLPRKRNS